MRVIGPKCDFILLTRTEGVKTADGTPITWTEGVEFKGVISAFRKMTSGQSIYHGKIGVEIDYKMRTKLVTITEEDRVKLKGTDRIFDVVFVDDIMFQGKVAVVDLHERKK